MGLISHNAAVTPAEKEHGHTITYTGGSIVINGAISSTTGITATGNTGVTTTADLTSTGGAISLAATTGTLSVGGDVITSVSGVGTGTVTLNAAAGQLSILSAGDITSGGTIELTGATGIVTAGDILTTGADVNFNSATTLSGNIAINTGSGPGTIGFDSTLGSGNTSTKLS